MIHVLFVPHPGCETACHCRKCITIIVPLGEIVLYIRRAPGLSYLFPKDLGAALSGADVTSLMWS